MLLCPFRRLFSGASLHAAVDIQRTFMVASSLGTTAGCRVAAYDCFSCCCCQHYILDLDLVNASCT
jgi:hypothetical protein